MLPVREMADTDVDVYDSDYDHRPRIVAVIPKMHIPKSQVDQPPNHERYGNSPLRPITEEASQRSTQSTKAKTNDASNKYVHARNQDTTDSKSTARGQAAGQRVNANAPQHQRENNSNLLQQQKRVQPVENNDYDNGPRTKERQTYGLRDRQDENSRHETNQYNQRQANGLAQVRVSIQTNEDSNTRLNEYDRETLFEQMRREYCYDKDDNHSDLVGRIKDLGSAKRNMATLSPKSPKPAVTKPEKEESIWDKIGTLGRKKRIKEVQEVQEEGKHAIDSPGLPHFPTTSPEDYDLEENEERCMIDHRVYTNPYFAQLVSVLINWINDELASQRIIVQDLAEDLYDGQVLQKVLEKLTGDKLKDVREVTQSEEGQKQKLHAVLSHFNQVLGLARTGSKKWNVEAIHSKNIVSIMHLLVALARHFRPPVRLTEHVSVPVVIVKKVGGLLEHRTVTEVITTSYDDVGLRCERDAIDSLIDHSPDGLQMVKKSLVTFVNYHLTKINLEVTDIETQFHDGVYLTFLMGLLEGFFVPLHAFHSTPKDFEQKVHNVCFAFELMEEVGITKLKARPEDIVNQDLKSTLRVLYTLFMRYKNICKPQ